MILFTIWSLLYVIYAGFFLSLESWHPDIDGPLCRQATWEVSYILVPVLSAFASFWFLPVLGKSIPKGGETVTIGFEQAYAGVVLTLIAHGIVGGYLILNVGMQRFSLSPQLGDGPSERINFALQILMFLSSLSAFPVGWILGDRAIIEHYRREAEAAHGSEPLKSPKSGL
jgi:hypothetical protein